MRIYLPRHVDKLIEKALGSAGAINIEGARATGKTFTAVQFAKSTVRLDSQSQTARFAQMDPASALNGETPRLLDEWQFVAGLWNEVRHAVDERQAPGQFILTGSASPDSDPMRHSGAGRIRTIEMRTMTFVERGLSSGQISSLAELFEKSFQNIKNDDLPGITLANAICKGGWPVNYNLDVDNSIDMNKSYINEIIAHDFSQIAGHRRNPRRIYDHLAALAQVTAHPASMASIHRRISNETSAAISADTVGLLHDFAQRLYLVEDQPAWQPRLRSKSVALQTPKRHLCDTSLACALLNVKPERLLNELDTLGFLFESLVTHDLRVYAQATGMRGVYHFRDTRGDDEIDIVVEAENGNWLAIEVKLGSNMVDAAAANLVRVCAKFARPPQEMIVIVPGGMAIRRREDGVLVIPFNALGP